MMLLLTWAVPLSQIRLRFLRLDSCHRGCNRGDSTRQKHRSCVPPTWTKEAFGKRSGIDRVFLFFRLQLPPLSGWSESASHVALTSTASLIVGLAAQQADRPDLIRSPACVFAHLWEGF